MPTESYASGTVPKTTDTRRKLQVKEIYATKNVVIGNISGVTGVSDGHGDPVGPPADQAIPTVYYNLDNLDIWVWDTESHTWK